MKLVALDYGGVMGDHHIAEAEERLASLFDVDITGVRAMLSERGSLGALVRRGDMTVADFWLAQARSCGLPTLPAPLGELSRMWAETYRLNPLFKEELPVIRGRARIGIVTNIDAGRAAYLVESVRVFDYVDYLWASYQLGYTKAEPAMWAKVARDGTARGCTDMLYVDDRPQHVESARAAGFVGLLHVGDVRATLDAIVRWVDGD